MNSRVRRHQDLCLEDCVLCLEGWGKWDGPWKAESVSEDNFRGNKGAGNRDIGMSHMPFMYNIRP